MRNSRRQALLRTHRRPLARLAIEQLETRIVLHHDIPDDPPEDFVYYYNPPPTDPDAPEAGPISAPIPGMGQSTIVYSTLANGMPILNSRPASPVSMFLDFDGDTTLNPYGSTSTPYDLDGNSATFNAAEQANIVESWRKVTSYFAMFDINVTTIQPNTSVTPTAWEVISNTGLGSGVSGVAYVGGFGSTVARAWALASNAGSGTQNTLPHEAGHMMGLQHQSAYDNLGNQTTEYRTATNNAHGIIMGTSNSYISKWFFGLTTSATTLQNDVAVIANSIKTKAPSGYTGDGFATDDFGNTIATASALPVIGTTSQATSGVIERYTDADVFSFTSIGGTYSIAAVRDNPSGIDVKLSIYDTAGNLIAAQDGNPTDFSISFSNDQYLTLNLASGTYYVMIESHGGMADLGGYLVSVNTMPDGWQSQTVGVNAVAGYASYDASTGTYAVSGGGTDLTTSSGGTQMAYQTLSGDGSIIARIATLDGPATLAKAGLMIRDGFGTTARFVTMALTYGNGPELMSRSTVGGSVTTTLGSVSTFAAGWLKLTRVGNLFSAYTSPDGSSWTQWGASVSIAISATTSVGLMTTSAAALTLTTGTFTNVSLTGSLNPAPTLNALTPPSSLTVTAVTPSSVSLAWSAVAGVNGYSVERSSDGVNYTSVASVGSAVTTYTNNSGLWDGDRFFYRIRANDASGTSVPSTVAVATTRPAIVTGATVAEVSTTQLVLTWTDVDGETGYRIERSTDQTNWTTVGSPAADISVYVDSGLTANTRYYYRVYTVDALGESAASSTFSGATRIPAVTALTVTSTATGQISFSWTGIAEADSYRIDRSTNATSYATIGTISGSTFNYVDSTVSPFTKYYYHVYGVNAASGSLGLTASTFASSQSSSPPASPWQFREIGTLTGPGAAQDSGGTVTLVTSGVGIGSISDRAAMLYQPIVGDTTITAHVTSIGTNTTITGTSALNGAGVIIREDFGNASKYIFARRQNDNTYGLEYRAGTSLVATSVGSTAGSNSWFRLTRSGNTFIGESSINGTTWTTMGTVALSMGAQVYVGLASESDANYLLTSSTFTNVAITGSNTPFDAAMRGVGLKANATTAGGQFSPSVAADANGNYVVVWGDDAGAIRAQRYNTAGTTVGGEFRVDTRGGTNTSPTVAMDAAGNFTIAWTGTNGSDTDIYAQRYDSTGALVGTQTTAINTTTTDLQYAPNIAMAPIGYYAISWVSANQDGDGKGVYYQRYSNTGARSGSETKINTVTTNDQFEPRIAADSSANNIIVWTSTAQDGALGGVYAKRISGSGTVLTADFLVNQTTADDQSAASVAAAGNNSFLVAWASNLQDGSGYAVMARLYSSSGTALTNEFVVNQFTTGDQRAPSVAVDSTGNFLVTWQSANQDGSGWGVYGRRFDPAGTALTREFRVHTLTADDQAAPAAALSAYGTGVVAWQSNNQDGSGLGVYFRILGNNETPTTSGPGSATVPKNTPVVVDLFALFADSSDSDDFLAYSVVGNTNPSLIAQLSFDGVAGTLTMTPTAGAAGSAVVTIRATDTAGLYVDTTYNLTLTNQAPTDTAISNSSVAENAGTNAAVGNFTTTDPNSGETFTYTLVSGTGSTDNAAFNISGSTLRANASFDFETMSSYSVRVRSTDAGGLFTEKVFAVTVTNVNEAPTDLAISNAAIAENTGSNATVGTLSTSDVDTGDTFTYTLVNGTGSTDNAAFNISGSTLRASASFDFEMKSSYSVRIRSTDAGGLFTEKVFAIAVTNVNDAPVNAVPGSQNVNSGSTLTFGTAGGNAISISDVDAGSGTMQVTLTAVGGKLTLATIAGLSFTAGDGTSDATMTFSGTLAALNTALDGLKFVPNAGFSGAGSLRIQTSDQGNSGGSAQDDDDTITVSVNAAPTIAGVYVRGTGSGANNWAASFLTYLVNNNLGNSSLGYKLSSGANQLRSLPWLNVNTVSIQFSEGVTIGKSDLTLVGSTNGPALPTVAGASFAWNSSTFTATWTFASSFPREKVLLHLGNTVVDAGGAVLDGDWTVSSSTVSGNGLGGGDFNFRFNLLPGDFNFNNSVTFGEIGLAQTHVGKNTASVGYNFREDFNASGTMTFGEIGQAQSSVGGGLGGLNEPIVPGGGPLAASVAAALPTFDPNGDGYAALIDSLRPEQLAPIVAEAEARWQASGLLSSAVDWSALQFMIGDLGPSYLGLFTPDHVIQLDDDGAGWGWFVDTTPTAQDEFSPTDDPHVFTALAGSAADGRMDLLTVVMHEIGHYLGFDGDDAPAAAAVVMSENLAIGDRRTVIPPPPPAPPEPDTPITVLDLPTDSAPQASVEFLSPAADDPPVGVDSPLLTDEPSSTPLPTTIAEPAITVEPVISVVAVEVSPVSVPPSAETVSSDTSIIPQQSTNLSTPPDATVPPAPEATQADIAMPIVDDAPTTMDQPNMVSPPGDPPLVAEPPLVTDTPIVESATAIDEPVIVVISPIDIVGPIAVDPPSMVVALPPTSSPPVVVESTTSSHTDNPLSPPTPPVIVTLVSTVPKLPPLAVPVVPTTVVATHSTTKVPGTTTKSPPPPSHTPPKTPAPPTSKPTGVTKASITLKPAVTTKPTIVSKPAVSSIHKPVTLHKPTTSVVLTKTANSLKTAKSSASTPRRPTIVQLPAGALEKVFATWGQSSSTTAKTNKTV